MSDTPAPPAVPASQPQRDAPVDDVPQVSLTEIFVGFLVIGATSFGGGVVAYLRTGLVGRRKWIADETFLELLSICQTLPGLNASNMAILVGDRLRGTAGAAVALAGICLPGGILMMAAAMAYAASQGTHVGIGAALHGISAAAVGLVLSVTIQLGRKTLIHWADFAFVALTVIGVNVLHQSVLLVLLVVGALAIFWYRPDRLPPGGHQP
ncbi:chromate transporter [Xanthobacter agilis]|uniref:Chromate transporter n=1 Tax=Xanthobacter agilis TaxID=47492 RepID=A0ABU0LBM8_XANAG|nr:chromate transporter [Xanthobacter agilis]MDQ0504547.1 chromate transporter [Xanthobacter agilis]